MGLTNRIERTEGRVLFGADPASYDLGRPGHAARVYEVLVEQCGLGPGTSGRGRARNGAGNQKTARARS